MNNLAVIIDVAVVVIGLYAIWRGYHNGLINQIVWLISFVAAYLVASRFAGTLATFLDSFITSQSVAVGVSFIILVIAVILIVRAIGHKITDKVKPTFLGKVNAVLGAAFNGLVFLAVVLIMLNVAVLIVPKVDTWVRETVVLQRLTALNHLVGDDRITNGLESAMSKRE